MILPRSFVKSCLKFSSEKLYIYEMLQEKKMYIKEEQFVNRFPQKVLQGYFYSTAAEKEFYDT